MLETLHSTEEIVEVGKGGRVERAIQDGKIQGGGSSLQVASPSMEEVPTVYIKDGGPLWEEVKVW